MWTRDAIEQVLGKHRVVFSQWTVMPGHNKTCDLTCTRHPQSPLDACLFDLLALAPPTPSMEDLERILRQWMTPDVVDPKLLHGLHGWWEKGVIRLLDWAMGKSKQQWCIHVTLSAERWLIGLIDDDDGVMQVPDEWTVCPICRAERPATPI